MFITDPGDPRLDDVRDLNSSDSRPDLPGGKGLVIGEGPLVVGRMLESRFPVREHRRIRAETAHLPGYTPGAG